MQVCLYIYIYTLPLNPNKPLMKVQRKPIIAPHLQDIFMTTLESPCKIHWLIPTSREHSKAQAAATTSTSST